MSPISFACQLTNLVHSVSDVLFPRLFVSNPAKYGSGIYPINNLVDLLRKGVLMTVDTSLAKIVAPSNYSRGIVCLLIGATLVL